MKFLDRFKKRTISLDRKVLRKNDISLLIIDERWNSLFNEGEKTSKILQYERNLKGLLKEQARLGTEKKKILQIKKSCMDRILKLTEEAYDKNNPTAQEEMKNCQIEINRINERVSRIEQEMDEMPVKIKDANLQLLEETANIVYNKIKNEQKRIMQLEPEIEEMKSKLKQSISEKEELAESVENAYSYFHDLLGGEEVEKLDKEFLGRS